MKPDMEGRNAARMLDGARACAVAAAAWESVESGKPVKVVNDF